MIETRLPRWVTASVALHLKTLIETTLDLQFFVEGVDREEKNWFRKDSVVLRVAGPTPVFGGGVTRYRFEVMTMLTDLVDDTSNGFKNHDRLGVIANALCGPVPVFRYGDGDTQVGCLDMDRNASEPLRIVYFGKMDKDTEVIQAAVVARYEICL
jgi:hypothetical protein